MAISGRYATAMLLNTALLQKYLSRPCSTDELLSALMQAGIEVEEEHRLPAALQGVRLGVLEEITPLPGTAGLRLCEVSFGSETAPVVCGPGHPLETGWVVPVVPAGTTLPSGKHVEAKPVAGQESRGMIGLDGEMGLLARGTGLQHWDDRSLAGKPFVEVAGVGDEALLDVSILPNRPDCLGLIGIARECAAALACGVVLPEFDPIALSESDRDDLTVKIEVPDRCSRYIGGVIEGASVGGEGLEGSPAWLSSALLTLGGRPINAVVDVTNFVMFEWGQPLHAFDLDNVADQTINVRLLQPGEGLKLLGDEDLEVPDGAPPTLVIADGQKPVALAGIKGGADSQTTTASTRLLLEAAHFERTGVRKTARAARMSTDSSYRFERGVDANAMLEGAFRRAASLIAELTGGTVAGPAVDRRVKATPAVSYDLSAAKASRLLGVQIDAAEMAAQLTKLGHRCEPTADAETLKVTVPTWRVDADDPVVLIEDVARLRGYGTIPTQGAASPPSQGERSSLDVLRGRLAELLVAEGFLECRSLPLTDGSPEPMAPGNIEPVRLANALNADLSAVRRSLVGSVLKAADRSARRGSERFRFFEIDRVFSAAQQVRPAEGEVSAADAGLRHVWTLAGVVAGAERDVDWERPGGVGFYGVKGLIENVLERAGLASSVEFKAAKVPGLIPGRSAKVETADGVTLGNFGELDQPTLKPTQVSGPAFAFELNLEALHAAASALPVKTYEPLPRFPASVRDLALVVPQGVGFAVLRDTIRRAIGAIDGDAQLESIGCFDRYAGRGVEGGATSLGLRLTFRAPGRTLTGEDVQGRVDAAVAALGAEHGVQLRG
ncbi:MAG: phenylalanine--tRNA ligase subunit beta [Planctomycetota bacterium]